MIADVMLDALGRARAALGHSLTFEGATLDHRVEALFALLRSIGGRQRQHPYIADLRQSIDRMPGLLGRIKDMTVDTDPLLVPGDPPLAARRYRATNAPARPALILYLHGGGFVAGDLESHDGICRVLASRTLAVVVSLAYRLAPEHPYPAAVDDCLRALEWAGASADLLGVAPDRIAVAGDSAGANLAAILAQARRHRPIPCVQWLLYPVLDMAGAASMEAIPGQLLDPAALEWLADQYVPPDQDRADPRLSPLRACDVSGVCPAIIVTAGFDLLCGQGRAYAAALRRAGVAVEHLHYPSLPHGFADFCGAVPASRAALDEAADRLAAALAAQETPTQPRPPGAPAPRRADAYETSRPS